MVITVALTAFAASRIATTLYLQKMHQLWQAVVSTKFDKLSANFQKWCTYSTIFVPSILLTLFAFKYRSSDRM